MRVYERLIFSGTGSNAATKLSKLLIFSSRIGTTICSQTCVISKGRIRQLSFCSKCSDMFYCQTDAKSRASMQFYSTKIILHRAIAGFGSTLTQSTAQNNTSKQICIDNAKNIASALQDFRLTYGEATTMSGVALHVIATASTVLIACIAEKRSADLSDLCLALKTCIRSLSEMEKTYPVARRVRKIIRLIMGLCYLDVDNIDSQQDTSRITALTRDPSNALAIDTDCSTSTSSFQFQEGAMDLSSLSRWDFLCPGDSPQGLAQFDIMYNLDI